MADGDASAQATTSAVTLVIPDELRAKYPELIALIEQSESMNPEERQYWVNILPAMTPDQVKSLRDILENERAQLAAIDQKYASAMQQVGQQREIHEIEAERTQKMQERKSKEEQDRAQDTQKTESILSSIEEGKA